MFGPTLEVAIGLVFTFVLFSSLLSVVFEALASVLKLRSKALKNAIISLIEDPQSREGGGPPALFDKFTGLFSSQARILGNVRTFENATGPSVFLRLYEHPLVAGLSVKSRPSYVPAANFSAALLYILRGAATGSLPSQVEQGICALPPGALRTALTIIAQEALGDWTKVKTGVEAWYDSAMDRLSGDYKRFSQTITFVLGLFVAVSCNVDSIKIVQHLYTEPDLRHAMTVQADTLIDKGVAPTFGPLDQPSKAQLDAVAQAQNLLLTGAPSVGWERGNFPVRPRAIVTAMIGWVITALAGMLGAPFWFDTLQKLVNLRGAGPKPKTGAQAAAAAV